MTTFDFVTERVAAGAGISSAQDVADILAAGISHVIDCRNEFDDSGLLSAHPEITYLWNPTDDDGAHKTPEYFGKSIAFALDALAHPKNKVLAHCAAGCNRGPSTAYAILRAQGYPAHIAEEQIRANRSAVGPTGCLAYKNDADAAVQALGYTDTAPHADQEWWSKT